MCRWIIFQEAMIEADRKKTWAASGWMLSSFLITSGLGFRPEFYEFYREILFIKLYFQYNILFLWSIKIVLEIVLVWSGNVQLSRKILNIYENWALISYFVVTFRCNLRGPRRPGIRTITISRKDSPPTSSLIIENILNRWIYDL